MELVKDLLNFCNTAVFYDYKNVEITCELNEVRKGIINSFYETIPHSTALVSLSIFDDIILNIHGIEIEKIIENIHVLRENIIYMLSFEKLITHEQQTIRPILNDDDDDDQQ